VGPPSGPPIHKFVLPTPWNVSTVQVYLIESEPLTLVDTGVKTPESRAALEGALESLGYGFDDIERVLLTHYHRDHLGQVQSLRDAGAPVELWAHESAVDMIENFSPERDEKLEEQNSLFRDYGVSDELLAQQSAWRREQMRATPVLCEPTSVERVLRDGDVVPFKDYALEVIHSPGHTAGHVLFHDPDSGLLFTGDHVMGHAVPNTENYFVDGLPAPGDPLRRRPRFKGLLEYRRSLRALRRRSFKRLLPGYGGVLRQPDRAIQDSLLYYDVRIQRIERGLKKLAAMGQDVTGFEIWKALFPNDDPVTEMRTRMLMVIGAIDVLEDQGVCVTERRTDGVLTHHHIVHR